LITDDILELGLFADWGPESKPDEVLNFDYDGRWLMFRETPNSFRIEPGTPMLTWIGMVSLMKCLIPLIFFSKDLNL
jgi:hypothetical protein